MVSEGVQAPSDKLRSSYSAKIIYRFREIRLKIPVSVYIINVPNGRYINKVITY